MIYFSCQSGPCCKRDITSVLSDEAAHAILERGENVGKVVLKV